MVIRVLIVEDDKLARKGLISMMPWDSYNMKVVGDVPNGAKALEFLENNPVDLMFVDLAMPVMSGIELMERVRKLYPNVNFVVLTFHENFEYVQTALRLGALDYISKAELESEDYDQIFQRIVQKIEEKSRTGGLNAERSFETSVNAEVWEKIKRYWYQLYWLYDDEVFEELCSEIEKNNVPVRYVEQLFIKLLVMIELATGIKNETMPDFKNTESALEWMRNFRESLYNKASQSKDLSNIPVCIMKAKAFVRENIGEKIRQEDVASHVNMSRSYFSQAFKKVVGITFNDYLKKERVAVAKKLLLESSQSLASIAQAVGYEDVKYFTYVFYEQVGMYPSEFRQKFSLCNDNC
ncbi:response regulator [Caldicoprobacter algeriensis]|uniref:response regulator transcription factor n=1 Tax=Caldicoprobacter algeriensis TaxID=699281 RepID=UPI00207A1F67|nr:response regulator [Caldicoprobacter algeriensis]MCM8901806.1 response regulator [Caldicoprobacter algeriensis]